ncbi:hypothetical protein [Ferrimonas marina]|uniref:Uncharacterized protein n=1 Tax=Ferrimonas marina TaxID=299255 RepID=A0A1M5VTG8_9GAMM|nr:hypothetical protein [Ferrimonas marina]SHH78294.1 hypothetical protein SAMN02745129_2965 [Ferrimonas marina]
MEIQDIREGMWVLFSGQVGRVVRLDSDNGKVQVEHLTSHQLMDLNASEVEPDPQLHTDCDLYY